MNERERNQGSNDDSADKAGRQDQQQMNQNRDQDRSQQQPTGTETDTLGAGKSGGFGNQTSGAPQTTTGTDTLSSDRTTGQQGEQDPDRQGGGFVGSQGSGSDAYLQQDRSTADTTGQADFARQGQGALEGDQSDVETAQTRDRDSDIEGSSGNA